MERQQEHREEQQQQPVTPAMRMEQTQVMRQVQSQLASVQVTGPGGYS